MMKYKLESKMKNLKELPNEYQEDIKKAIKILKENGATEIYIFGSIEKGNFNKNSDIDIAIRGVKQENFYKVASILMFEIEKEIDLIDLDDENDKFARMLIDKNILVRIDNML